MGRSQVYNFDHQNYRSKTDECLHCFNSTYCNILKNNVRSVPHFPSHYTNLKLQKLILLYFFLL